MKFLVTGATGFIGARVVARLLQERIPTVATDVRLDPEVMAKLERSGPRAPTSPMARWMSRMRARWPMCLNSIRISPTACTWPT